MENVHGLGTSCEVLFGAVLSGNLKNPITVRFWKVVESF